MNKFTKSLSAFSKGALSLLFLMTTLAFAQEVIAEENHIINGSFEEHGDLNHGSWGTFRSIEGWQANRGFLEVQHNNVSGIGPVNGIAKIELDSYWNSRIYQNLNSLIEGETYRLSLYYSPRTTHRNSNKIRIKWNRDRIAVLNGREQGWTQYSFDVVAQATNRLKFHAAGRNDSYGGLLDDVTLVCITCDITPPTPTSTVNTRITTPSGEVLGDVSIVATSVTDGTTTTFSTSTDGNANLILDADQEYVLKLDKAGYATQVVPISSPSENGTVNLEFTMIARGATQTFAATTGGTFTGDDGAEVIVSPNSFVDSNGDLVNGDIELTITSVDVSNPATLAAFPGEFSGIQSDGTQTQIISLGTVEYKFTQNGEELQLDIANGATAEILIPIYTNTYQDGTSVNIGDTIPLWSLTEATGIWLQEGTGVVVPSSASPTGLAMRATVSHFTWWNCDVTMNSATANVTVNAGFSGTASVVANATACDIAWRPSQVNSIININETVTDMFIPDSCSVCFTAELTATTGFITNTNTQCVNAAPDGVVDITLNAVPDGPLNLLTNGNDVDQDTASGVLNNPIGKIQFSIGSFEPGVSFSILSGALPPGITLKPVSVIKAEISGIATTAGVFTVEVGADNQNGTESDSVTLTITITDPNTTQQPLLVFDNISYAFFDIFDPTNNIPDDLTPYNAGAAATSWEFVATDSPIPTELSISADGIVSYTGIDISFFTWSGIVRATNAFGSDEANIELCGNTVLGGCVTSPAPGDYAIRGDSFIDVDFDDTSVTVKVILNQAYDDDISFDFTTVDGTAQAGVNYTAQSGSATIVAGEQQVQTIVIDLLQNPIFEGNLSFDVVLSNVSFGRIAEDTIKINIGGIPIAE